MLPVAGRTVKLERIDPQDGSTFIDWKIEKGDSTVAFTPTYSPDKQTVEFTMPATNLTLTALYGYELEVKNGIIVGDGAATGFYPAGTKITLRAQAPAENMCFTGWTGTDGLSITTGSSAEEITFLMPNHAVSISANYEEEIIPPPQTGDNTPIALLTVLCALSLVGISMLTLRRRKAR